MTHKNNQSSKGTLASRERSRPFPNKFKDFCEIIKQLRDPENGCPWDKKQTFSSLKNYILEEAYESVEAISQNDYKALKEELGDLLLQIILQSQIASEKDLFTIDDVIDNIRQKIILCGKNISPKFYR